MMKYIAALFLSISVNVYAENICQDVKSRGEGHWPIPEREFTKENAKRAIKELDKILNKNSDPLLTSKSLGGLDISPYIMNRLVFIKGFALRSEVIEDLKLGEQYAKWSKKEFCEFLEKEAFTWH